MSWTGRNKVQWNPCAWRQSMNYKRVRDKTIHARKLPYGLVAMQSTAKFITLAGTLLVILAPIVNTTPAPRVNSSA